MFSMTKGSVKKPRKWKFVLRVATWCIVLGTCIFLVSCVRFSGGTWLIREAPVPADWPEPTGIGEVQVKRYPLYRAAVVTAGDVEGSGQEPMFRILFRHIKKNEIAMTAPVAMGYAGEQDPEMASMEFMYRDPEMGRLGPEDTVQVQDVPAQTLVSIGVRGDYTDARFKENVATLTAWLASQGEAWETIGPPRYLGYNSPFVPRFMRYGEVQIPVRQATDVSVPEEGTGDGS